MKYPHHNLVLAWLAGEAVQYFEDGLWHDMPQADHADKMPHFYRARQYRKKPLVLRFRLAVVGHSVVAVNSLAEEKTLGKVEWLGDWVEVER